MLLSWLLTERECPGEESVKLCCVKLCISCTVACEASSRLRCSSSYSVILINMFKNSWMSKMQARPTNHTAHSVNMQGMWKERLVLMCSLGTSSGKPPTMISWYITKYGLRVLDSHPCSLWCFSAGLSDKRDIILSSFCHVGVSILCHVTRYSNRFSRKWLKLEINIVNSIQIKNVTFKNVMRLCTSTWTTAATS